ncbi:hypothetical protein CEXT_753061, partial [Caerostris extrusa]
MDAIHGFSNIKQLTWSSVPQINVQVFVPIGSVLLVVETQNVTKFVDDCPHPFRIPSPMKGFAAVSLSYFCRRQHNICKNSKTIARGTEGFFYGAEFLPAELLRPSSVKAKRGTEGFYLRRDSSASGITAPIFSKSKKGTDRGILLPAKLLRPSSVKAKRGTEGFYLRRDSSASGITAPIFSKSKRGTEGFYLRRDSSASGITAPIFSKSKKRGTEGFYLRRDSSASGITAPIFSKSKNILSLTVLSIKEGQKDSIYGGILLPAELLRPSSVKAKRGTDSIYGGILLPAELLRPSSVKAKEGQKGFYLRRDSSASGITAPIFSKSKKRDRRDSIYGGILLPAELLRPSSEGQRDSIYGGILLPAELLRPSSVKAKRGTEGFYLRRDSSASGITAPIFSKSKRGTEDSIYGGILLPAELLRPSSVKAKRGTEGFYLRRDSSASELLRPSSVKAKRGTEGFYLRRDSSASGITAPIFSKSKKRDRKVWENSPSSVKAKEGQRDSIYGGILLPAKLLRPSSVKAKRGTEGFYLRRDSSASGITAPIFSKSKKEGQRDSIYGGILLPAELLRPSSEGQRDSIYGGILLPAELLRPSSVKAKRGTEGFYLRRDSSASGITAPIFSKSKKRDRNYSIYGGILLPAELLRPSSVKAKRGTEGFYLRRDSSASGITAPIFSKSKRGTEGFYLRRDSSASGITAPIFSKSK